MLQPDTFRAGWLLHMATAVLCSGITWQSVGTGGAAGVASVRRNLWLSLSQTTSISVSSAFPVVVRMGAREQLRGCCAASQGQPTIICNIWSIQSTADSLHTRSGSAHSSRPCSTREPHQSSTIVLLDTSKSRQKCGGGVKSIGKKQQMITRNDSVGQPVPNNKQEKVKELIYRRWCEVSSLSVARETPALCAGVIPLIPPYVHSCGQPHLLEHLPQGSQGETRTGWQVHRCPGGLVTDRSPRMPYCHVTVC